MGSRATAAEVEGLYRRFGPVVYRRCRRLLSSDAEAQDCLQDTFVGYLKGDWRQEAQPLTVLYRIATFQAIDRLRRQARWHGRAASLTVPEADEAAEATFEAQASQWAAQQQALGPQERLELAHDVALLTQGEDELTLAAATMHWVEGHTLEEVAQTLGVTRKTVAARLTKLTDRAKRRLGDAQ